eukprot:TRINITY_DN9056_c0_g1_i1.p1 TRINITY_DN9056_c0_g1~~TRINITY_DN9056_c0_g1_i1.p1  ORF type:complete len:121 (+),score=30.82 TRINITY_DN9056_c0_g1_i1:415-777(+)
MIDFIHWLRSKGIKTAALTNNWTQEGVKNDQDLYGLAKLFDIIVESRLVKLRKPDPKIYKLVLDQLQLSPHQCLFLDDIGANLKPAREMGLNTIHVSGKDAVSTAISRVREFLPSHLSKL